MGVSSSALVQRVRNYLDERPYSTTATATDGSTTSITVGDNTAWEEGAILEFQDNGEQCLVTSAAANPITVRRGWNGTTTSAHSSILALRDPTYLYATILQAVNGSVRRLWPYAYKLGTTTVTPAPTTTVWYSLASATDLVDLVRVQQLHGATNQHVGVFGMENSGRAVIFARNMPATISTTGLALKFPHGFWNNSNVVDVQYRARITGTSDIEDDDDLPVSDAVVYGALELIFLGQEGKRVGEGEDAEPSRSVSVGGRGSLAQVYGSLFRQELQVLKLKHEEKWPPMRTK